MSRVYLHVPTRMIPAWKKLTGYQDITSQKYGMGRALGAGKKRISQQKWKDAHEAFVESVTQEEYLRRVYAFASSDIKAVNAHKKQFVKDCVFFLCFFPITVLVHLRIFLAKLFFF